MLHRRRSSSRLPFAADFSLCLPFPFFDFLFEPLYWSSSIRLCFHFASLVCSGSPTSIAHSSSPRFLHSMILLSILLLYNPIVDSFARQKKKWEGCRSFPRWFPSQNINPSSQVFIDLRNGRIFSVWITQGSTEFPSRAGFHQNFKRARIGAVNLGS